MLSPVVEVLNPVTMELARPAYVDIRPRVVADAEDDRFILVDGSMHWSHLGLKYLGDARNWWAIADLSGVVDPFTELEVGRTVKVPSIRRFLFDIMAGRT
jgi:hypothetical protein